MTKCWKKIAHSFPKVDLKKPELFLLKMLRKYRQKWPIICATFEIKYVARTFKNRPIWSHCFQFTFRSEYSKSVLKHFRRIGRSQKFSAISFELMNLHRITVEPKP